MRHCRLGDFSRRPFPRDPKYFHFPANNFLRRASLTLCEHPPAMKLGILLGCQPNPLNSTEGVAQHVV